MKKRWSHLLRLCVCSTVLCCVSLNTYAQDANSPEQGWINFGIGYGWGQSGMSGSAANFGLNGKLDNNRIWSLGIDGVSDTTGFFGDCVLDGFYNKSCGDNKVGYASGIAIRYGVLGQGELGFATMSLGPSYVSERQTSEGGVSNPVKRKLGLSLESQMMWTPFEHFGIGLIVFGNINGNHNFSGVGLNFAITDMK